MLKNVDVNNDILTFPFNDRILGFGEIELIFSICYAFVAKRLRKSKQALRRFAKPENMKA